MGTIVLAKDFQMFTTQQGGVDNPLACDFSIFEGVAYVMVPYVDPGYDYQIVCECFRPVGVAWVSPRQTEPKI